MKSQFHSVFLGSLLVLLTACGGDKADSAKIEGNAKAKAESAPAEMKQAENTGAKEAATPAETAPVAEEPEGGTAGILKVGEDLVAKNCSSCHQSEMYTRPDHKVKSPEELLTRVKACDANLGTALFDEDIIAIAKYLDTSFYKFSE